MFLEYFLHIMQLEDDSECNSEKNCVYDMISGLLVILFFVMFYMSFMFSPICRTGEIDYYVKDIYVNLWGENIYSYIPYIILSVTMLTSVSLLLWKHVFNERKKKCMEISYIIGTIMLEINVLLVLAYMRTMVIRGIDIALTNWVYFLTLEMFFLMFPILGKTNRFNDWLVEKLKKGWWTKWIIMVSESFLVAIMVKDILHIMVNYINIHV